MLTAMLGLPFSLVSGGMLIQCLWAAMFGAPMGWWIDRAGGGWTTGAWVGAVTGTAYATLLGLATSGAFMETLLVGMGTGLLPGILLGWLIRPRRCQ